MFKQGQQITVKDGGWTGVIQAVDIGASVAYIQFPDRPDRLPYACEALMPAMFDQLTERECSQLARKLSSAGHAFSDSAHAIGSTALHLAQAGKISPLSPEWEGLWNVRAPLVDAMDEMFDLMIEADNAGREHAGA